MHMADQQTDNGAAAATAAAAAAAPPLSAASSVNRFPSLASPSFASTSSGSEMGSPAALGQPSQRGPSRTTSPIPLTGPALLQLPSALLVAHTSAPPSVSTSPTQRGNDGAASSYAAQMHTASSSVILPPALLLPVSPPSALGTLRTTSRTKLHTSPPTATAAPLSSGSNSQSAAHVGSRLFAAAASATPASLNPHTTLTSGGSHQGSGPNSADPSRATSPIRFQAPLTLPGNLALAHGGMSMGMGMGMGSGAVAATGSTSTAAGSSHILPIGVGSVGAGVLGRGIMARGSVSGSYTPQAHYMSHPHPPLRVMSQGTGLAQPLQPHNSMLSKSVGHSGVNSGNVTFKGPRPTPGQPVPLTLPGVGRVSREEEEASASQRARDAQQQQQQPHHWSATHSQHQLHHMHPHHQAHLAHSHSQPHVAASHHNAPHPHILSPLAKAPSAAVLSMHEHNQQQQQQQQQQQHAYPTDADTSRAPPSSADTSALHPSTSVLPSSSSHRRILSLPLYVSSKKPRAYRSHITYAELGGVVKENSIGGGKSAAEALASLVRPLAAAADASLIDESSGRLFAPQRHTQAYKSHFQKKSHQAVFALFAALDRNAAPTNNHAQSTASSLASATAEEPTAASSLSSSSSSSSSPPPDAASSSSSSSDAAASPRSTPPSSSSSSSVGGPDVGLFYAQFFRSHFIELMEAHFPQSSQAALAMLGNSMATDRTTASSLAGSGLSAEETKLALHAVVGQAVRAMECEALRIFPGEAVAGAGCSFCILLISGGVLYTYNSSFVTPPAGVGGGTSVSPSSGQRSLSSAPPSTPPFQVTLCRSGKGIDVSGSGTSAAAGHSDPHASLLPSSPSHASTSLAGSFGFNSLLLSSSGGAGGPGSSDMGGGGGSGAAALIHDRVLAPQDEFVLMAASPLWRSPAHSATPHSPAPAATAFPDANALCSFVLASPTPQVTVDRIVDAHARAMAGTQQRSTTHTPLLLSLIYF